MRCGMGKNFWRRVLPWTASAFVTFGLSVGLAACSSDDKVAGVSTVETENAYIIKVADQDGAPVVHAVARLRAASYVPNPDLSAGVSALELVTDSAGYISMDSLIADSMTLEILEGNMGLFVPVLAENVKQGDSAELVLEPLRALSGKIDLPEGEDFGWVSIYGTDRVVKTDSNGYYEIAGLAPADYRLRIEVAGSVSDSLVTVLPVESLYLDVINFDNGLLESNIKSSGLAGIPYLKPTDTLVTMSPVEDSAALAIVDAGAGREGKAFHWTSSAETGRWSFFGFWMCHGETPCDLSALDSIEYYVRGTGSYSFNMESITDEFQGKAVFLDTLGGTDEWERVVIKPSDFMQGDSTYGNMGWPLVGMQVTNIAVCAYFDTDIWIDDITFYGVNASDLK